MAGATGSERRPLLAEERRAKRGGYLARLELAQEILGRGLQTRRAVLNCIGE